MKLMSGNYSRADNSPNATYVIAVLCCIVGMPRAHPFSP